jgi:phosphatidylinositol glycan class O
LLDTKHSGIYLPKKNQLLETGLSTLFIFFQSGMLSFSNSYIEAEQKIVMFMMAILGGSIFVRMQEAVAGGNVHIIPYSPLMIPILSRVGEIMVSGHGLDPSIRLHPAHSPYLFIPSLVLLLIMRIRIFRTLEKSRSTSKFSGQLHLALDTACLLLLVISWLEKRSTDTRRNGYLSAKGVIGILTFSIPMSSYRLVGLLLHKKSNEQITLHSPISRLSNIFCIVTKLLIAMMLVTGPATSTTVLLVSIQAWMLYLLGGATGFYNVSTVVQSILWRFTVRHVFFSTNHGCAFNRLQYSAAFVATNEFGFALGGLQLFLNTFGKSVMKIYL